MDGPESSRRCSRYRRRIQAGLLLEEIDATYSADGVRHFWDLMGQKDMGGSDIGGTKVSHVLQR